MTAPTLEARTQRIRQVAQGCATHLAGPVLLWNEAKDWPEDDRRAAARRVVEASEALIAGLDAEGQPHLVQRERMVIAFVTQLFRLDQP